uniref:Uncharacterized protein n=1 Tax=Anguilla anguilla TaxID=7936 RepID=A0A0E9TGI8_ANGAN
MVQMIDLTNYQSQVLHQYVTT